MSSKSDSTCARCRLMKQWGPGESASMMGRLQLGAPSAPPIMCSICYRRVAGCLTLGYHTSTHRSDDPEGPAVEPRTQSQASSARSEDQKHREGRKGQKRQKHRKGQNVLREWPGHWRSTFGFFFDMRTFRILFEGPRCQAFGAGRSRRCGPGHSRSMC